jgi:hypothetical protein
MMRVSFAKVERYLRPNRLLRKEPSPMNNRFRCGTMLSITTAGKERVLFSFTGGRDDDGAYPEAPLIDVNCIARQPFRYGG